MDMSILKSIFKCILFGVIWATVLFVIALIVTNYKNYALKDVLFVEGIFFIIFGILSSLKGNSLGIPIQGLGQSNAQYITNANLHATDLETNKFKGIKTTLSIGLSAVSFMIGGVIAIIINFIL
ncbi:hypothetical protein [uncultured Clostridium sp.]|uniref:hypothetical protein n=1 Tax=uncultured Clostridium sp. TaxID=59620 RepID=UPI002611C72C|nr:hypothetical protein [uncultured Clostridium sp.]